MVGREAIIWGERFAALPYEQRSYPLSNRVRQFVQAHDMREKVTPIEFWIEVSKPLVREIRRHERRANTHPSAL